MTTGGFRFERPFDAGRYCHASRFQPLILDGMRIVDLDIVLAGAYTQESRLEGRSWEVQ